jgi:hypothetical protein
MLFACIITVSIILPYWYQKKCSGGRFWTTLIAYLILISMFFAFLSLWIVWTPLLTNLTYHDGEYQGDPPLNKLSYPFFLSVYHTPHLDLKCGKGCSGIVSFKIFFANIKISEINGSFSYPSVFGEVPLNYKINLPFFETKEKFFALLLATFTIINLAGAVVGILIYSTVKRIRKSKTFDS